MTNDNDHPLPGVVQTVTTDAYRAALQRLSEAKAAEDRAAAETLARFGCGDPQAVRAAQAEIIAQGETCLAAGRMFDAFHQQSAA